MREDYLNRQPDRFDFSGLGIILPRIGKCPEIIGRAVVIIVLITLTLACDDDYRTLKDDAREKGASVRISNFARESVDDYGRPRWYLKSGEAYLYRSDEKEGESRIIVYDFEMEQYDNQGVSQGLLMGDVGNVDYENQKVHVKGNVKFVEGPEKEILADEMDYDMSSKILTSDSPVIIKERGVYTRCETGIIVEKEVDRQVCKNPAGYTQKQEGGEPVEAIDGLFH